MREPRGLICIDVLSRVVFLVWLMSKLAADFSAPLRRTFIAYRCFSFHCSYYFVSK
jgi:hypothetical protein